MHVVRSMPSAQQRVDGSLIPGDGDRAIHDLLDWLGLVFGFQVWKSYFLHANFFLEKLYSCYHCFTLPNAFNFAYLFILPVSKQMCG